MTKAAVKNIPKSKLKAVTELSELLATKKTTLYVDISNIPSSQFQQIAKKLRGKAIVKVPKKSLFFRALDENKIEKSQDLKNKFDKPIAVLFSDLDSFDLASDLIKNKSPAKAKAGQIAPTDIEVPAGPTDLMPGPAISELGALGIQIQIQGGKIEIKAPKVVAPKDKPITQGAADILSKLDIKPFTIGFTPLCAYDKEENTFYSELVIDTDKTLAELLYAYQKALPFALEIGYVTNETARLMITKAARQERRLIAVITGEPLEIAQPVEVVQPETPKEEPKEEKVSSTEGLASLFG